MSRLKTRFDELAKTGRKALIPFITAGDPNLEFTVPMMHAMVEAGADVIELGVPFSDPMADGPVIQRASERALEQHMSLRKVLSLAIEFRKTDQTTPVVLMGYLNPIEIKGYEQFALESAEAGVDGALIVDLPPEEADALVPFLKQNDLDSVFLIAPTTTEERIKHICQHSSGYVYYVSIKGVTGSATLVESEVADKVALIKSVTDIPVCVGFGIRDAESAAAISKVSNGVIVGSVIVNLIDENQHDLNTIQEKVSALVSSMRHAMDA